MHPMSPWRAAMAMGAETLERGKAAELDAVGIDSRSLRRGALFIAIQGVQPGERYFGDALAAGAAALAGRHFSPALRREARRRGAWLLRVDDGQRALQALAAVQRLAMDCPVVALTGSNGKTGAKDLLTWLMAGEGPVLSTRGNFNNHLGVPLTLLRARPGQRYAVLEAGMNHAGELRALGRLIRPDLSVVLNAGSAHAGHFADGRRGVARAKEELLDAMGPGGIAVLNADDPAVDAMGRRFQGRVVRFGRSARADLRLLALRDRGAQGLQARLRWSAPLGGRPAVLRLHLFQGGRARWTQAAAALAAALSLGCDPRRLAARAATWRPAPKLRQEVRSLGAAHAILDAYNASPESMRVGLEFLALSAPAGKRLAVLGSMLELGRGADAAHRALGRLARAQGVRALAALGPSAKAIARGFGREAAAFGQADARLAAIWMAQRLTPGDWVLFKGSRGMAVERVYDALTGA